MIINALAKHYELLPDISPPGFQETKFAYTAVLTVEGELLELINHIAEKGSKPQTAKMPKSMKIKGIAASPVCDNAQYVFGIDDPDGKKFGVAKVLHERLFGSAQSKEARAIVKFFENWDLSNAQERFADIKFNGNIAFKLAGEAQYFHEVDEIKQIWLDEVSKKEQGDVAPCAVSGKSGEVARLHTQLKGIKGAQVSGASLVSFNKPADESYNLSQSFNSRVSEVAMFKYTTALQFLLNSSDNKIFIGDDTCVFWASSTEKIYEDAFAALFGTSAKKDEEKVDKQTEYAVQTILSEGVKGITSKIPNFDPSTSFHVLGLAPNAARISVRYFYQNTFGDFCEKIRLYHNETKMDDAPYCKPWWIIAATVNSKAKNKQPNPLLGGALMRAILTGNNYPQIM